jgi:predicted MFS family arabinose efflux permease
MTFSIVGGALADRLDRRTMLVTSEAAGFVCTAVLVVNAMLGHPQVWLVYVAAFGLAAVWSVAAPTGSSAIPLIVEPELITPAMALRAAGSSAAWLLGPAIGGVLYAISGPQLAYGIDALTFILGAAIYSRLRPFTRAAAEIADSTWQSIREGLRLLRSRQPVIGSFLMDLNAMVFGFPSALFPAIVDERFDGRVSVGGLLAAAPFAGSLVASASSGWSKRVHRHGVAITAAVVVWGLAIVFFGFATSLWASLLMLAIAGGADMVSGVFRQSMLALDTPPELLGRMEGVGMAVWASGPALGDLESGAVASLTSVTASVVSGGLICIGGAVALFSLLPGFGRYDARRRQSSASAGVSPTCLSVVAEGDVPQDRG